MINIGLNIFISILSAVILYGLIIIIKKIVIPWYQKIIYKGLNISGQWFEKHETLILQESAIFIKQSAQKISGEIILTQKKLITNDNIEIKQFKFKGDFYNNFINIACKNKNQKRIGIHNYLLRVRNDGNWMDGTKTYYDVITEKIISEKIYWHRKDNEVQKT